VREPLQRHTLSLQAGKCSHHFVFLFLVQTLNLKPNLVLDCRTLVTGVCIIHPSSFQLGLGLGLGCVHYPPLIL